ncbi:MAG: hypothetical protein EU551_03425 [Promethearchaeota archaeon]|nr:MAG: hypothetical protein EU551_03425 [Candidatus Lokiarchaeota archaeon]
MNSVNNEQDEELEDDLFTLDDQKFNDKFKEILEEQEKIRIWVEPIEDKLKLFIKNGTSSKKLVARIQFEQFKKLQNLGVDSTVDQITVIIPNIDEDIAKQLSKGLIKNAKSNNKKQNKEN